MFRLALLAFLIATPAFSQAIVVDTCGALTLTPGSTHYPTMDKRGYLCVYSTTTLTTLDAPVYATAPPEKADEPKQ